MGREVPSSIVCVCVGGGWFLKITKSSSIGGVCVCVCVCVCECVCVCSIGVCVCVCVGGGWLLKITKSSSPAPPALSQSPPAMWRQSHDPQ